MGLFDRFFGPPTLDKFATIMIDALKSAGDTRTARYVQSEGQLVLSKDGEEIGVMNLHNLYKEFSLLPGNHRQDWLRHTVVSLLNPMEIPDDFEDVKPDLYPSLRPKSLFENMLLDAEIKGNKSMDAAAMSVSEHLAVCLVYDLPNSIRFVSTEELSNWGTTLYEAMEVATHNLEQVPFPIASIDHNLYFIASADGYDATRMLLLDGIRKLEIAGDPVALPFTRDILLITGSDDELGLGLMLDFVEKHQDNPRPVCSLPHRLVDDEWQPWTLPEGSPHFNGFHTLKVEYFAREYADQKDLIDNRNEQTQTDVFVPSYSAIELDKRVVSYALWVESLPTWLPQTDLVVFMRDKTSLGFVPWERVTKVMGDSMKQLNCYPPRWFVETFPDEAQLAELQPSESPV